MKQNDDLLHNYTVAKITTDCDFSKVQDILNVKNIQHIQMNQMK